jgi:hypothetical protein
MMAHTYNSSYSGGKDWEDLCQPGQKVSKTPISVSKSNDYGARPTLSKNRRSYLKNNLQQKGWGCRLRGRTLA